MKVVAYARCSTDHQEASPTVQLAHIREYCEKQGHTIVGEYIDEDTSGGTSIASRPAFLRLLADAKSKGAQALVCSRLDRLSRDNRDLQNFLFEVTAKKLKVEFALESYEDSPAGKMLLQVMGAFNEFYRNSVGKHISDHNRWLASQGKWKGGPTPYGYLYDKDTKQLVADPERARYVPVIFQTFIECGGNLVATARALNTANVPVAALGRSKHQLWRRDSIAYMIRNPIYLGIMRYNDLRVKVDIEQVVDAETVIVAQRIIETTRKRPAKKVNHFNVFASLVYCARCGGPLRRTTLKEFSGKRNPGSYVCQTRRDSGVCDNPTIAHRRLEPMVVKAVGQLLARHRDAIAEGENSTRPDITSTKIQITKLTQAKERLLDLYTIEQISRDSLVKRIADIDEQIMRLESAMAKPETLLISPMGAIDNFEEFYEKMLPSEKRALLLMCVDKILVEAQKPGKIRVICAHSEGEVEVEETLRKK